MLPVANHIYTHMCRYVCISVYIYMYICVNKSVAIWLKQETLIKLFQCTCLRMGQKRRLVEGHPTFDAGGSDAQIISGGTTGVATAEMNAPFWDCPSGEQGRFPLSAAASTSSYVGTGYVELEGTSYETAHRWPARARPGATLRIKIRNMK